MNANNGMTNQDGKVEIKFTQPSPLLKFFTGLNEYDPTPEMDAARAFEKLALYLEENLTPGTEKTVALRKLLESRDAALRTFF